MLDKNAEEILKRMKVSMSHVGNLTPEDVIVLLAKILEDYEIRMW